MPFLPPNPQRQSTDGCVDYVRVATNLEYSGISLNMENFGNSVQRQGKIVTNELFLSLRRR